MKRFALLLLSILLSSGWLFSANRVEICSQAGFDRLSGDLDALCHQAGDSLVIHFAPGVYSFSEQHLSLRHVDLPRLQLVLEGEGATFIACGETLCLKDAAGVFMADDHESEVNERFNRKLSLLRKAYQK